MSSAVTKEWFSAQELAHLSIGDMPGTKRGMLLLAEREGWATSGLTRPRNGRGGGVEYHASLVIRLLEDRAARAAYWACILRLNANLPLPGHAGGAA